MSYDGALIRWPSVSTFSRGGEFGGSSVIKAALEDIANFRWQSRRKEMAKEIKLVTAYAMADAKGMFDPDLHDVTLWNAREAKSDYESRPKFARTLVARVLDHRLNGCAALPLTLTAENAPGHDFSEVLENLNIFRLQTMTEISGTVAVRPWWDPYTHRVQYSIYSSAQIYPYLGDTNEILLGIVLCRPLAGGGVEIEVWGEDAYLIIRADGSFDGPHANPYLDEYGNGVVPVSIFRVGEHPWSWWGPNDVSVVTLNNIASDKMWSDLIVLAKEQSINWYVFYYDRASGEFTEQDDLPQGQTAPSSELRVRDGRNLDAPLGSKVEAISPGANITGIADTIEKMTDATLDDAYVISARADKVIPSSGFSLMVQEAPYRRKMTRIRSIFGGRVAGSVVQQSRSGLAWLIELAEMVRFAGMNPGVDYVQKDAGFKVTCEWDETPLLLKPQQEKDARDQFDSSAKVISRVDMAMRRLGVSRDVAIETLRRVDAETKKFGAEPEVPVKPPAVPETEPGRELVQAESQ